VACTWAVGVFVASPPGQPAERVVGFESNQCDRSRFAAPGTRIQIELARIPTGVREPYAIADKSAASTPGRSSSGPRFNEQIGSAATFITSEVLDQLSYVGNAQAGAIGMPPPGGLDRRRVLGRRTGP